MLGDIYKTIAKQMQELFTEALKDVTHPLELGLARERLVVEYLKRFIPERFGIDTGFVVDINGNISKQIDIVIYDRIISPVFELPGKLKYFPVESVVAIGEVKSTITDREKFRYALENLVSVQKLDRFSGDKNLEVAVHGAHGHHMVMRSKNGMVEVPYRILSFIFTSKAMTLDTMIEELMLFKNANEMKFWPNIVLDFENYLISYVQVKNNIKTLEMFPDDAVGFYSTRPVERDRIVLLFATLIANFLTIAQVVRPVLLTYFEVEQSKQVQFHAFR